MDRLLPGVFFVRSPVFELLASLFRLQCHEHLTRDPDGGAMTDFDLDLWVKRVRAGLSPRVINDLEVFFHFESYMGLAMVKLAWEKGVSDSVEAFLAMLSHTASAELFRIFLNTGYTPGDYVDTSEPGEVWDYLNRSNLPESEKGKLAYLYLNMDAMKNRVMELLAESYSGYFSEEWDRVSQLQAESLEQVTRKIQRRQDLLTVFPYLKGVPIENPEATLVLAPSVFYHWDSLSSFDDENRLFLTVYGTCYSGRPSIQSDEVTAFLKVIVDDTRMKIIKILALGPSFGYELAQRLNLSSSTISHHVSILADVGVVVPTRQENRVHYALDRDHLQALLGAVEHHLLG